MLVKLCKCVCVVLSTELGKLHNNSNNSGQMRPTQWAGAPMPALDPCLTCVRSGHGKFTVPAGVL